MSIPRIEYDREADAAYISFVPEIGAGGVARTVSVSPSDIGGMVNLDLDDSGRIIGLEVMDASRKLPPDLLGLAP
jgi:uncharacterized protein YuzE